MIYCTATNWNGTLACGLWAGHKTIFHEYRRAAPAKTCGHAISAYPYKATDKCGRKVGHHGLHMVHPNKVETKQGVVSVHNETQCLNDAACVIHDPSNHHMREWPMVLRMDRRALVERVCTHGTGHPDPDSLMYFRRSMNEMTYALHALGDHGCDGCCAPPISA